jgi:ribosomal protein S18 acetylase RimI-like enzyme
VIVDTGVDGLINQGSDPTLQPYRIRSATLTDSSALATLLSQSFPLVPTGWEWLLPLVRLGIYEDIRQRLRSSEPSEPFFPGTETRSHYACWVAVAGSEIVGTAEISWKPNSSWARRRSQPGGQQATTALRASASDFQTLSGPPYLANLAVSQNMRRRGVAEALLNSCEREVQSWGRRQIDLHVMENNLPARQLYLKAGYQIQHRELNWRTWLFQRPQRLLLRKSFE